jgi:hypothetical protein
MEAAGKGNEAHRWGWRKGGLPHPPGKQRHRRLQWTNNRPPACLPAAASLDPSVDPRPIPQACPSRQQPQP